MSSCVVVFFLYCVNETALCLGIELKASIKYTTHSILLVMSHFDNAYTKFFNSHTLEQNLSDSGWT